METDYVPFDLWRMFFGEHQLLFYLELLVRVLIVYGYTLVLIRWVGGRGIAQLSMVEFLLVIALGSAVGDSMFYPDVPIIVALAVITIVVGINKMLDLAIARSARAKVLIDGRPVALVRDGVLLVEGMRTLDLGMNEVKAMLRREGIANLGQVGHAYMEVGGAASVFRADRLRPGLAIVPPQDLQPPLKLNEAARAPHGLACCAACGLVRPAAPVRPDGDCANCGNRDWVAPLDPPEAESVGKA